MGMQWVWAGGRIAAMRVWNREVGGVCIDAVRGVEE